MLNDLGPQYSLDNAFKAAARLHQSRYRADVLNVTYDQYGNRLNDADGRALLNYYGGLGVRDALRKRYPGYSKKRDADMLRSEHIPFNMFAPLEQRPELLRSVLAEAFGLELIGPYTLKFEWAPEPASDFLDDRTSFDVYVEGADSNGEKVGLGIEVKYTEQAYRIGRSEAKRVECQDSTYWTITHACDLFRELDREQLAEDSLRQIWRNHLLGVAMARRRVISRFASLTLYPAGNTHFRSALERYQDRLDTNSRESARGCTYERFINALHGSAEIEAWKEFLKRRYLVVPSAV